MNTRRSFSRRRFLAGSAGAAALALTPSLLTIPAASARSTGIRIVNSGGLRLRSGAGLGSSVIASLSYGTEVIYLGSGGWADGYEWAHVELLHGGQTGYVAAMYLSSPSSGGGWEIGSMAHVDSTSGRANLRSSPSTSGGVVAVLNNGLTGTIQEGPTQANGYTWYKINFGDVAGWMATVVLSPGGGSDREEVTVADGPLNVRSQPGLSGSILGSAATGATGFVTTEMPRDADGYTWVNVQFSHVTGWVASDFLSWS